MIEPSLRDLRTLIEKAYSDEEIDTLIFDHFIELFPAISPEWSPRKKTMQLLNYCRSRELLHELITILETERPVPFLERLVVVENHVAEIHSTPDLSDRVEELTSDEDIALFDLLDEMDDVNARLWESAESITEATEEVGRRISASTTQMNTLTNSGNPNRDEFKNAFNTAAADLEIYSSALELEVPKFSESVKSAIDVQRKAIALLNDFPQNRDSGMVALQESLQSYIESLDNVARPLESFRDSVIYFPRMTKVFNRAKRNAVTKLDYFVSELRVAQQLAMDNLAQIRQLELPTTIQ